MAKRKKGNRTRGEHRRIAALKGWATRRRRMAAKGIKIEKKKPTRPKLNPTTVVFKRKAKFDGEYYTVYGKEGTRIRTIFPRPEKHPKFAKADFGETFWVEWLGKRYRARKEARWQENNARVPCLVWETYKSEA